MAEIKNEEILDVVMVGGGADGTDGGNLYLSRGYSNGLI